MKPTPYSDINGVLQLLKNGLVSILGDNLIALYLTGSLTYGDFDRGSSDIDFLVVMDNVLPEEQLLKVRKMHEDIGKQYPEWRKRIEGSYITKKMLLSPDSPKEPRPYFNAGKMWNFVYGDEWVLNLDALYRYGVVLFGPSPKEFIKPVNANDIKEASKRNLLKEWQRKLVDSAPPFITANYDPNHLQAYAILTMCRILYTAKNGGVVSKSVASAWAKKTYGKPWSELIEKGENWKHGAKINAQEEILKFIQFTIDIINENRN